MIKFWFKKEFKCNPGLSIMVLKNFIELIRPLNCAMASIAVFIGYLVSLNIISGNSVFSIPANSILNLHLAIAMIVAFMVCGAGQAINDFFDREIDKKKNPKKPIPSGKIMAKTALHFSLAVFLLANILSFLFLNETALYISTGFSILLIAYSAFLAKLKYLGNWIVAGGTAFTLIFGAALVQLNTAVILLAISALLANVCREIIKDFEDLDSDKGFKTSLPMIAKKEKINQAVFAIYSIAMLLPYWIFSQSLFGNAYFMVLISAANILFIESYNEFLKNNYSKAQSISKNGMIAALIAFAAGTI